MGVADPILFPDQRSVTDQLRDLQKLANEHGLYDAADWVEARLSDKGTFTGRSVAALWPAPPADPRFALAFSVRMEDEVRGKGSVRVVKTKKKSGATGVRGVPEKQSAAWERRLGTLSSFLKPKPGFVLPLSGPLIVRVLTGKTRPKTIGVRDRFPLREEEPDGLMLCPVKPDWDNIGKSVCDGLAKGRVFTQDSRIVDGQVVTCWARKGEPAFTEICVYALTK